MSVATDLHDTEQVDIDGQDTLGGSAPLVPTVKLDITNNWTGREELPFEVIAERVLEIEAQGPNGAETGPFFIRFAKPVLIENQGWACVFQMSAMGREHASPARGVDAVDAIQQAFAMVQRQLTGMGQRHRITFGGAEDLGFSSGVSAAPKGQGCPVMNGTLGQ
jgi:hypothetical protein